MSLTPSFDDLALWLALSSTTDLWLVTLGTWPQNRKHKRFPCKYSGKELVWEKGAVAWEENERTALRIMATWNVIPHSTRQGEYAACSQTGRMCMCVHGLRPTRQQRLSGFDPGSPAEPKRCCHTQPSVRCIKYDQVLMLCYIWSRCLQSSTGCAWHARANV